MRLKTLKKIPLLFSFLLGIFMGFALFSGAFVFLKVPDYTQVQTDNCPFCQTGLRKNQTLLSGNQMLILLNYEPIKAGHFLLVPKRHVKTLDALSSEEALEMHKMIGKIRAFYAKRYQTTDYVLLSQNGYRAGQTVFHAHMHMLPREESRVAIKLKLWNRLLSDSINYHKRLSLEMVWAFKMPPIAQGANTSQGLVNTSEADSKVA